MTTVDLLKKKKWKDMAELMKYIPPIYHSFYKTLPRDTVNQRTRSAASSSSKAKAREESEEGDGDFFQKHIYLVT